MNNNLQNIIENLEKGDKLELGNNEKFYNYQSPPLNQTPRNKTFFIFINYNIILSITIFLNYSKPILFFFAIFLSDT